MKSVRLLPVVIFASLALLVFKGIGLVTEGGYVLTGPRVVVAAEGGSGDEPSIDAGSVTPSDPTLVDSTSTLDDSAPTLETGPATSSSAAHGDAAALGSDESSTPAPPAVEETGAGSSASETAQVCADASSAPDGASAEADCVPSAASGQTADATPTMVQNNEIVPLESADSGSESALLQRLGERRAALDKREADLNMQAALLDAAQKKLDERTKELQDLQSQVAALVDQKKAAEDANFKSIVTMYEQMKPKDAAKIFDGLDVNILIKVAQAMNPRKMSAILGAMSPEPAEALTTVFASSNSQPEPTVPANGDVAALPQIVGH